MYFLICRFLMLQIQPENDEIGWSNIANVNLLIQNSASFSLNLFATILKLSTAILPVAKIHIKYWQNFFLEVKVSSPDYKNRMTEEQAREDFLKRIENYKCQYEPLDEELDDELSFIKVINAGRSFFVHNVNGHVQSRVVYFLMSLHLLPRSIYLTRVCQNKNNF